MEQEVQERLHFLQAADIEGDLFGGPVPARHRHTIPALLEEQRMLALYNGGLIPDAVKLIKEKKRPVDNAVSWALIRHGFPLLAGFSDSKAVQEFEKLLGPTRVSQKAKGAHLQGRHTLKPKWVNVSQAARELGIQRSTILKWYAARRVLLPGEGGFMQAVRLRRGAFGDVDLTLLAHIKNKKLSMPGPGRRLAGGDYGEMFTGAIRAHGSSARARDYSRTCKAISLLERVHDEKLLQAARRQLNRLILRRRRA